MLQALLTLHASMSDVFDKLLAFAPSTKKRRIITNQLFARKRYKKSMRTPSVVQTNVTFIFRNKVVMLNASNNNIFIIKLYYLRGNVCWTVMFGRIISQAL